MRSEGGRRRREAIFRRRGELLALPAIALVFAGQPTRASIACGLPLALAGEALRCWAVGYAGTTTRGSEVTAPQLVTAGPYAHLRNPLYLGNLITALGFSLAFCGGLPRARALVLGAAGIGTMLAVYSAIVPLEENYLRETFGAEFEAYVARVPRLLPRLRPAQPQVGRYHPSVIVRAESRTFLTFGAMVLALAWKFKATD
ncbi:MAG: methyltransferase family protein [Vulcanimicrobiaceae bacterium]